MSRDISPFGVRMPAALKEQLQSMAADNKRSLNAEIVAAIELACGMHQLRLDIGSGMLSGSASETASRKKYRLSEDDVKSMVEEITFNVLKKLEK